MNTIGLLMFAILIFINNYFKKVIYKYIVYVKGGAILLFIILYYFKKDLLIEVWNHRNKLNKLTFNTSELIENLINKYIFKENYENMTQFKSKRNVSESKKKLVASNQQWRCANCNNLLSATYEIDHILPLYKGGTNDISNLNALCRNCHGDKTLMDRINQ